MFRTFLGVFQACGQDGYAPTKMASYWTRGNHGHARAQRWLRHAQAHLMHAQAQLPCLIGPRRPCHPFPVLLGPMTRDDEVRLSLSMHELSVSMPEPILSLSVLIFAAYPEV